MPISAGQLYRANSFDLGFINITPVEIVLQVTNVDDSTDELELIFMPAAASGPTNTVASIGKWFKEVYPSKSKENCMLKSATAFERFVALEFARPEPSAQT